MARHLILAACISAASAPAFAQDVAAGAAVFQSQCATCHSAQEGKNGTGPSLFDIVGQPAGRVAGFAYSANNTQSGVVWTPEALDLYVTAPHRVVPGTAMPYGGLPDARKRADLIAYLQSLK